MNIFRLTGSYAFIIFFVSTVWRHCDLGPFHYGDLEADQCSKTPWTNLLYVNNFDLKYIEDRGSVSYSPSCMFTYFNTRCKRILNYTPFQTRPSKGERACFRGSVNILH